MQTQPEPELSSAPQEKPAQSAKLIERGQALLNSDRPEDAIACFDEVLAAEPGAKFLLLGDMAEVGERGVEFHEEIGRYARERGIDRLYATGELCRAAVAAFGEGARHYGTVEEMTAAIRDGLGPDTAVLVKGSRSMPRS